jgi:hypothetical protein
MKTVASLLFTIAHVSLLFGDVGINYPSGGEGNTNTFLPFGAHATGTSTANRYQQVYDARGFTPGGVAPGGEFLTYIAFRADTPQGQSYITRFTNLQVYVSTTARSEGSLSPVFAENVGSDNILAFSGAVGVDHGQVSPGPQNWDFVIRLNTPFYYDPAQGNLLLDILVTPSDSSRLDAYNLVGDGTARVVGDANNLSGTADTLGLVTRLQFVSVPEPKALALLLAAAVLVAVFRSSRVSSHG